MSEILSTELIKEIARKEFDIDLTDALNEIIRAKLNTIINYNGKGVDNLEELISAQIKILLEKIDKESDLVRIYYIAKNLFKELSPEGQFYFFDKDNLNKPFEYLKKIKIGDYTSFFNKIINKFKRIKECFGSPIASEIDAFTFKDFRGNDVRIIKVKIAGIQKDGDLILKGTKGSFNPHYIFNSEDSLQNYLSKRNSELKF